MELVHDFSVPVPPDRAFDVLLDVKNVASCMPGAVVTSVEGDSFQGGMKIKLGPIAMTFKGDGALVDVDRAKRRVVVEARGRDAKGNGGARATVTATLAENSGRTDVHVVTDLNVTGKAAQFGAGVMKDVSNKLLAQFAQNLEALVTSGSEIASQAEASKLHQPQEALQAFDLLPGGDAAKKWVPIVGAAILGLLMGYLFGKGRALERAIRRGY